MKFHCCCLHFTIRTLFTWGAYLQEKCLILLFQKCHQDLHTTEAEILKLEISRLMNTVKEPYGQYRSAK